METCNSTYGVEIITDILLMKMGLNSHLKGRVSYMSKICLQEGELKKCRTTISKDRNT